MAQDQHGDGLLSRAELEIELARLVLKVERSRPPEGAEAPALAAFAAWYEGIGGDLLERVAPELRPFCLERLQQIAQASAGLELTRLEVDRSAIGFTAADTDD